MSSGEHCLYTMSKATLSPLRRCITALLSQPLAADALLRNARHVRNILLLLARSPGRLTYKTRAPCVQPRKTQHDATRPSRTVHQQEPSPVPSEASRPLKQGQGRRNCQSAAHLPRSSHALFSIPSARLSHTTTPADMEFAPRLWCFYFRAWCRHSFDSGSGSWLYQFDSSTLFRRGGHHL